MWETYIHCDQKESKVLDLIFTLYLDKKLRR
jgi:hypothetical protein